VAAAVRTVAAAHTVVVVVAAVVRTHQLVEQEPLADLPVPAAADIAQRSMRPRQHHEPAGLDPLLLLLPVLLLQAAADTVGRNMHCSPAAVDQWQPAEQRTAAAAVVAVAVVAVAAVDTVERNMHCSPAAVGCLPVAVGYFAGQQVGHTEQQVEHTGQQVEHTGQMLAGHTELAGYIDHPAVLILVHTEQVADCTVLLVVELVAQPVAQLPAVQPVAHIDHLAAHTAQFVVRTVLVAVRTVLVVDRIAGHVVQTVQPAGLAAGHVVVQPVVHTALDVVRTVLVVFQTAAHNVQSVAGHAVVQPVVHTVLDVVLPDVGFGLVARCSALEQGLPLQSVAQEVRRGSASKELTPESAPHCAEGSCQQALLIPTPGIWLAAAAATSVPAAFASAFVAAFVAEIVADWSSLGLACRLFPS